MEKVAVLLVNLGSPAAPTARAVKTYLKQLLSDKRVVDLPRTLWLPLLHAVILNVRPKKVAKAYRTVWGEGAKAPLVREADKFNNILNGKIDTKLLLAMRYGEPSIFSVLDQLKDAKRLIVLPMFPQYSSATTASVFDAICSYFKPGRSMPGIDFIRDYHQHPLYIKALANSVREYWDHNIKSEKLVISFHGLPQRYVDEGDPYFAQCQRTASLLAAKLKTDYILVFQSRFGKEPWLKPYLDETIIKLAKQGVKTLDVISPGFSIDCLETLEELAIAADRDFKKAGGKKLNYIPALNSSKGQLELYLDLINSHLFNK